MSTKLTVASAAVLFGVALAVVAVISGIGSLPNKDVPGQVLQVGGIGPVFAKPSVTAKPSATATKDATPTSLATVTTQGRVGQVAPPAAQPLPSYRPGMPSPMASSQPSAPQPAHHSPGMHSPGH